MSDLNILLKFKNHLKFSKHGQSTVATLCLMYLRREIGKCISNVLCPGLRIMQHLKLKSKYEYSDEIIEESIIPKIFHST